MKELFVFRAIKDVLISKNSFFFYYVPFLCDNLDLSVLITCSPKNCLRFSEVYVKALSFSLCILYVANYKWHHNVIKLGFFPICGLEV